MWGNTLGWAIAAVLAVLIGVGVVQLAEVNRLTPPTAFAADPAVTQPLTTEISPDAVYRPTAPGDAGPDYRRAVAAAGGASPSALADDTDPAAMEQSPPVAAVLAAADRPARTVLADPPEYYITYRPPAEWLATLADTADVLCRAGLLRLKSDPAAARRDFEAAFALGRALFDERLRYDEAVAGLNVMDVAAGGLRDVARAAGDAKRAALLDTFVRSADTTLTTRLLRPWNVIASKDLDSIDRHSGDVFAIAGHKSAERMWRVEAILKLGQYKFNAVRAADQLAIPRRLRELAEGESDPVILAAIHAAQNLTVEQYRMLPE